jgi:hypothetical protein
MPYWIYYDEVTPTAKLHHDWCGACKYGRGMHGHQKPDENEWLGAYDTKEKAIQVAREKDIFLRMTGCGLCKTTVERA